MARDRRLSRLAVQWGGLALVAQLWVALTFVQSVPREWHDGKPRLDYPSIISDRISQMKPALFKFPFSGIYLTLFLLLACAVAVGLFAVGLRRAMAPEPERDDDDETPSANGPLS